MRIIIIGPAHPLRGGLATFNQRLAEEFNDQGHDCSIVSFSLQYPGFLFPGTSQYSTDPPSYRYHHSPADQLYQSFQLAPGGQEIKEMEARYHSGAILAAFHGSCPWNDFAAGQKKQAYQDYLYCGQCYPT